MLSPLTLSRDLNYEYKPEKLDTCITESSYRLPLKIDE